MSNFELGKEIETDGPTVQVTPAPGQPLPLGKHRFQLIVEDEAGNQSQPAFLDVIVRDPVAPTAIIQLVGGVDPAFNTPFELDASLSTDAGGGTVVKYHWTLVATPAKPVPEPDPPLPPAPPSPVA
jgi:hypothetical protein